MKNFVQPGEAVTVLAPTGGVSSGDGVLIGSLFGVAAYDAAQGAEVEIVTVGAFDLPKIAEAIAVGNKVYFDPETGAVSDTDTTATALIGVAIKAAATNDPTCRVRLDGISTVLSGA